MLGPADEREAALALPVGCLDHAREGNARVACGVRARLGHGRGCEAVALPGLGGRQRRRRAADRMGHTEPLGDPGGDADRPVRARRDDPVRLQSAREPLDGGLVLGRDHGPLVREREPRRLGVPVGRDHVQITLARRLEQPELRNAGA